jgi:hypothetical protein
VPPGGLAGSLRSCRARTSFDAKALKDLPPGSVYTEPARQPHFAQTTDEPVVIWVSGYGPSDTRFVQP